MTAYALTQFNAGTLLGIAVAIIGVIIGFFIIERTKRK